MFGKREKVSRVEVGMPAQRRTMMTKGILKLCILLYPY